MIAIFIILCIICGTCWLGYKFTGALLTVMIWLFVKLPLAVVLFGIGIAFCASIIFIPLGIGSFKAAGRVLA